MHTIGNFFGDLSQGAKDALMRAQTLFMGIMMVVLLAAVPWAYVIGVKVAVMETNIKVLASASKDIALGNSGRIDQLERRAADVDVELKVLRQYADQLKARKAKEQ